VTWDAALVLQRFRDTPELAGLFDAGRVAPEAIGAAVARLADRLGSSIAAILGPVARDLIALPVDATTLANVVMLVPQDRTDALDAALCDIDAIWTEGFRIRQIGPAAPCSFVTLHPRWISAAHIADAHALLDVTPTSPAQTLDAARKAMLRHGTAEKERIDAAHRIAVAAARVRSARGFHLCDIWRDGSALALPSRQDAA
jgi:Gas vesicle synthesis protein GvpL/GvpF